MEKFVSSCQVSGTKKVARSRTGFTLIELLVVIAIIAILAAILFPVFARARENARRSSCMSNLKQIALGVMQYTQDYDEKFPFERDGVDGPAWYNTGAMTYGVQYANYQPLIFPYVKSKQIFMCPSSSTWTDPAYQFAYNYAMNSYIGATSGGFALAALEAPSETLLLGDSTSEWIDRAARIHARHLSGANLVYCDGHVKWLNKSTIAGQPSLYYPGRTVDAWLNTGGAGSSGPPPENCPANSASCT